MKTWISLLIGSVVLVALSACSITMTKRYDCTDVPAWTEDRQ